MRKELWALLIILALALLVRVHDIGASCFWQDEFYSVEASTGRGLAHADLPTGVIIEHPPRLTTLEGAKPWWKIWTSLKADNHPPLYFILLRFWRSAFGEGDTTARMLSVVPSLIGIVLIWWTVRLQYSQTNALWAALLMTVATSQIYFAQQTRGYSLLIALVIATAAAVGWIEKKGSTFARLFALSACCLAMMLTHYFAIASIFAIGLYILLAFRDKARWKSIAAIIITAAIYAIIWVPWLLQQRSSININNSWQIEPAGGHVLLTLTRLLILPMRMITESASQWTIAPLLGAIVWIAIAVLIYRCRRRKDLLWLLLLICPIAMVATIDLVRHSRHLDLIRYTVAATPGLYVLLAKSKWVAIPAILAAALTIPKIYSFDQSWNALANNLQARVQPGDLIIYASAGRDDWYAGTLYLGVSHYAPNIPAPIIILDNHSRLPELSNGKRVWIVAGTDQLNLPQINLEEKSVVPDVGVLMRGRIK